MALADDLGKTVSDWFAKLQAPDDDFSQMPLSYQDQAGAQAVEAVAMAPVHAVGQAIDDATAAAQKAASDVAFQVAAWGGVALIAYIFVQRLEHR
jgi:hypothetical protein